MSQALLRLPVHADVVVVGTGFSGMAAFIKLTEAGQNVVVLERAGKVGGTWRDNSYPGCACDVPSHVYSFSFMPNPSWSRIFGPQQEIRSYLERVASTYDVAAHTCFNTDLLSAVWDTDRDLWQVSTTSGDITCRILIMGTGLLSAPAVPSIKGLDSFTGACFHSATWDHAHDFTGERVAVIGTGASAIQFAPEVAKLARHTTVFQRTAPWILPRRDRAITSVERTLFRLLPWTQTIARGSIWALRESWILGFKRPSVMKQLERLARHFLAKTITDPHVRSQVTPDYRLGCKRVLLSNTWYPMLAQEDVSLVSDRITEVTASGIITTDADGKQTEHEIDTILLGTGFSVTDPPVAHHIRGSTGQTLAERWSETGMSAHRGMSVPDFPNLFWLIGPNTGFGHTSVVYVAERQAEHLVRTLAAMDTAGVSVVDTKESVRAAYDKRIQRKLKGTVWNAGGCSSWYLDAHGRNSTLWPTFATAFGRELSRVDLADYAQSSRPAITQSP